MHEFAQNARSNKFIFYRYMSKQLENGWLTCWLTSWYDNRRKHAIWYENRHGPAGPIPAVFLVAEVRLDAEVPFASRISATAAFSVAQRLEA